MRNGTYIVTAPYCTQYNGTLPSPGATQYLLTNCTDHNLGTATEHHTDVDNDSQILLKIRKIHVWYVAVQNTL